VDAYNRDLINTAVGALDIVDDLLLQQELQKVKK